LTQVTKIGPSRRVNYKLHVGFKAGLRQVADKSVTALRQIICSRKVADLVSDKIDLMEFGIYRTNSSVLDVPVLSRRKVEKFSAVCPFLTRRYWQNSILHER